MFVAETGAVDHGPAVLLLHALGLDHEMWHPHATALSDRHLLAPDLPGFGRSRAERAGLERAADACAELLAARGLAAVVAGVSYGGYVAAVLAATHPELVTGLVLSGVRRDVPRSGALLQAMLFRGVRRRALARGETVENGALTTERRNLVAASRELGTIDLRPVLARITAPTIVFAPDLDRFVRREVPYVSAAIQGSQIIAIPGAGHLWTRERPAPFVDAIRSLSRHPDRPRPLGPRSDRPADP